MRRIDFDAMPMGFEEVAETMRRNPHHTREALNTVMSCLYATKNSTAFVQFAIRRYLAAAVTIQRLVRKALASMRLDVNRELSRWISHDEEVASGQMRRSAEGIPSSDHASHSLDGTDGTFLHFDVNLRYEVVEAFYKQQRDAFRIRLREWGEHLQRLVREEKAAQLDLEQRLRSIENKRAQELQISGSESMMLGRGTLSASLQHGGSLGMEGSLKLLGLSTSEESGAVGVPPIIASLEEQVSAIVTRLYRHKQRKPRFEFSVVFSDLRKLAMERYRDAAGRRVAAIMTNLGLNCEEERIMPPSPSAFEPNLESSSPNTFKAKHRPSSATRRSLEFNEMFERKAGSDGGGSPNSVVSAAPPLPPTRGSTLHTSIMERRESATLSTGGGGGRVVSPSTNLSSSRRSPHNYPLTPPLPSRPITPSSVPTLPLHPPTTTTMTIINTTSSAAERCYASLGISPRTLERPTTTTVRSNSNVTTRPSTAAGLGHDHDGTRNADVDRFAKLMAEEGEDCETQRLQDGDDTTDEFIVPPSFKWHSGQQQRRHVPRAPASARIVRRSILEPSVPHHSITPRSTSTAVSRTNSESKLSGISTALHSSMANTPSRPSGQNSATPRRRVASVNVASRKMMIVPANAPQVAIVPPTHTLLNARDIILETELEAKNKRIAGSIRNVITSPRTNKSALLREELKYYREWPLQAPTKQIPGWCDARGATTMTRDPLVAAQSHLDGLLLAKTKAMEKLEVLRAAQRGESGGAIAHMCTDSGIKDETYPYHHFYSVPSVLRGTLQDPERQLEKLEVDIRNARAALEEEIRKNQLVLARPRVVSLSENNNNNSKKVVPGRRVSDQPPTTEKVTIHKHLLKHLYPDEYFAHKKKAQQDMARNAGPKTRPQTANAMLSGGALGHHDADATAAKPGDDDEADQYTVNHLKIMPVLEKYNVSEATKMAMENFDSMEYRNRVTAENASIAPPTAARRTTKNRAPSSAALKVGIETQSTVRSHVAGVTVVAVLQVYEDAVVKGPASSAQSEKSDGAASRKSYAVTTAATTGSRKVGFAGSSYGDGGASSMYGGATSTKAPGSTVSGGGYTTMGSEDSGGAGGATTTTTVSLVASGSFDGGLRITAMPNNMELFFHNTKDTITSLEVVRPTDLQHKTLQLGGDSSVEEVSALVALSDDKTIRIVRRGKKRVNDHDTSLSRFEQYASSLVALSQQQQRPIGSRSKTVGMEVSAPSKALRAPSTLLSWSTPWYLHATIRLPSVPMCADFFQTTPPPTFMNRLFKCYSTSAAALKDPVPSDATTSGAGRKPFSTIPDLMVSSASLSPMSSPKKKLLADADSKRRAALLEQLTAEFHVLLEQMETSYKLLVVGGYDCVVRLLPLDYDVPVSQHHLPSSSAGVTAPHPPHSMSPSLSFANASSPNATPLSHGTPNRTRAPPTNQSALLQKVKGRLMLSAETATPGGCTSDNQDISPLGSSFVSRAEVDNMSMISLESSAVGGGGGGGKAGGATLTARQRLRSRAATMVGGWNFKHPYNHHHVIQDVEDNRYGTEDGRVPITAERSPHQKDLVTESDNILASLRHYALPSGDFSGTGGGGGGHHHNHHHRRRESISGVHLGSTQDGIEPSSFRRVVATLTMDGHVLGVTKVRSAGDDLIISTGLDSQCFVFRILPDSIRRGRELANFYMGIVKRHKPSVVEEIIIPQFAMDSSTISDLQVGGRGGGHGGGGDSDSLGLSKHSNTFMTGVDNDSELGPRSSRTVAPRDEDDGDMQALLLMSDTTWLVLDSARPFACHSKGVTDMVIVPASNSASESADSNNSTAAGNTTPKSTIVCTSSLDCTVAVWDALALDLRHRISFASPVRAPLIISPNFGVVVCCLENASVVCWSTVSGAVLSETAPDVLQDPCLSGAVVGKHSVALGTYGGRILLLNMLTGTLFGSKIVHGGAATGMAVHALQPHIKAGWDRKSIGDVSETVMSEGAESSPSRAGGSTTDSRRKAPPRSATSNKRNQLLDIPREVLLYTACDDRYVGCHHVVLASDPVTLEPPKPVDEEE